MTKTPRSATTDSLNESWVEIDNNSPYHYITKCNESKKSSLDKIVIDVQSELIHLKLNKSNHEDDLQLEKKLSSNSSGSPFEMENYNFDQLDKLDDKRFNDDNSDWLWYWKQEGLDSKKDIFFIDKKENLRQWAIKRGIFSKEVLSLLVLSNVVSVVIGVGIGYTALIRRFL